MKSPCPGSSTLITSAPRSARPRKPEHALREDVPLDLGRSGEQRRGTIVEIGACEAAAADGMRTGLPAQTGRPEHLHHGVVHALAHLAPEELHEAGLGAEWLTAPDPGQRSPVVEPRDRHLDPVLRKTLAEDGVGTAGVAREP